MTNGKTEPEKPTKKRPNPWAAKRYQGRPRGQSSVHKLPVAIREECHARLATRYPLEHVQAWLIRMGFPTVTVRQLEYYRTNYVKPASIIGGPLLSRWLKDMGIRIDPLTAHQKLLADQLERVSLALKEEKDMNVIIPQAGSEVDRADTIIGHYHKLLQDAGLVPLPVTHQQIELAVEQNVSGGLTHDVGPATMAAVGGSLEEYRNALKLGFADLAKERELAQLAAEGVQDAQGGEGDESPEQPAEPEE